MIANLAPLPTRTPAYEGDKPVERFEALTPLMLTHGDVDKGDTLVAVFIESIGIAYLYHETGTGTGLKWSPLACSPGPVELLLENFGLAI